MSSAVFRENIYNSDGRRTTALVTYNLTAPDSKFGGVLNLPAENEISRFEQIMNEVRIPNAPIATFEPKYWRLDGTFIIPTPNNSDISTSTEYGWWSEALSGEDGTFQEPLVIERIFDQLQTFNVLGIVFDAATNNFCTDIEVFFYDGFGNLSAHERVTDNNTADFRTGIRAIDIIRVVIVLRKTNRPFRYARIVEIDFGLILEYQDDILKSVDLIQETNPDGMGFILPELSVTILNRGLYDILDRNTYAPYFLTRQRFEYKHGLILPNGSVEWVNCGNYFLRDWRVSDNIVNFTASGINGLLEQEIYFDSNFGSIDIARLVGRIFPQSNIALQSPPITPYFGNVDYRRILSMLAELTSCLVYEDGDNIINFVDMFDTESVTEDNLNYNNIINVPKPKLKESYNAINLTEYTLSTEFAQVSRETHRPGRLTIYFTGAIIGEGETEVTEGFEVVNIIWNSMYMICDLVQNTANSVVDEAEITISGERVNFSKQETVYRAPWHSGFEPDNIYKVDLPMMIKNADNYEEMRDWFLERRFKMLNKRLECEIRYYGNPERIIGDNINVQLGKNSSTDMIIYKRELNWQGGALTGRLGVISESELK